MAHGKGKKGKGEEDEIWGNERKRIKKNRGKRYGGSKNII